jgi:heavy metal translocating P-type ATPase
MIAVIQTSLYQKNPLENRTDQILRFFTPTIILLALGTGGYCLWSGYSPETVLVRAMTVMVIACPCALGIAVPMARVAGISLAGRKGIIVREFDAFEQPSRLDTIVFDKTGTLTTGQWRLLQIEGSQGYDRKLILQLSAGLESNSDHLIAMEIRRFIKEEGLSPMTVTTPQIYSDGVAGYYQGKLFRLGSRRFVQASPHAMSKINTKSTNFADHMSRIFLSVDGIIVGTLYFGDQIRSTTQKTIKKLIQRNIQHIHMVTGDDEATAQSIASQVGITAVQANMLPLEKAAFIDKLKAAGHKVAMMGDGINDAPALSRADLSVAIATANPLTDQASQIVLMGAEPGQLCEFFDLSGRVIRSIQQNLWCSLVYNLIGIPLAMGGWISPLVAVTAMLASSLTVTINTLRLTQTKKQLVKS